MSAIDELKKWLKRERKQINFFRKRESDNRFFIGIEYFLNTLHEKIEELEAREGK